MLNKVFNYKSIFSTPASLPFISAQREKMTDRHQLIEFVDAQGNDYETLMDKIWNHVKTLEELTSHHRGYKIEITSKVKENWRRLIGSAPGPNNLTDLVQKDIDERFKKLVIFFKENNPAEEAKPKPWENISTNNSLLTRKEYAVGIDLGTTMCCVGVVYNKNVEIVQNFSQKNAKITPSYVAFLNDGSDTFGYTAKDFAYQRPEETIYDAKRMIGRVWNDPVLQNDRKLWPFEIVDENGNPKIKAGGRTRYPHEISARLLCRFRGMAEEHLNLPKGSIRKAVITVPAYFSEPQRRATYQAAQSAGYEVLNILNEPTAAAIAYNHNKRDARSRKALIYDLGGGTFDVSIAEVKGHNVQVLCVAGDSHLGGQDVDQLLMNYCIQEFQKTTGIDLLEGVDSTDKRARDSVKRAISRLRPKCEQAKEWLANSKCVTVDVPCINSTEDLSVEITIQTLNELCKPLVERTIDIVKSALEDAKEKGVSGKDDIEDVILIGGSTRLQLVQEMLGKFFEGKTLCKNINPDEAVAYGAAVQADVLLQKQRRNSLPIPKIEDVTPLTLGIECLGDTVSKIISRNHKVPCSANQTFSTSDDNQTSLRFTVCQGENEKASENVKLGEFYFEGIPEAAAGEEEINLTMVINELGILHVSAVSETTGSEASITITANKVGMTEDDVTKLSRELEALLV